MSLKMSAFCHLCPHFLAFALMLSNPSIRAPPEGKHDIDFRIHLSIPHHSLLKTTEKTMQMKLNHTLMFTAATAVSLFAITAVESNFVSYLVPGQPAVAGFFDGLAQEILPSGLYFEIEGKKFYFGEYSQYGDEAIVYEGSKWEIKYKGQVTAHGYGQTPQWIIDIARRSFGF
jgi:hypothetical protein